ncbi:MAG: peptidoglycan DD-metalloendopeptidase family protein [Mollicutes bacterium]|nr:peptidoglycan DD-metalloendopeptidase family protein [Mollicutes bacterium]
MRKIFNILMIIVLVIPYVILPEEVEAKTLGDLKRELAELEAEIRQNKKEKEMTEQQITNTRTNIQNISEEIEQIYVDIENLNKEIVELNIEIVNKNEEIKKIMNFVQTSNGESAYLEFAFGAKDFTDFIYRVAISEQLASYNKNLIETYKNMIEANKLKEIQLNNKTVELTNNQQSLSKLLSNLNSKLTEIQHEGVSIEEDIRMQKEVIKLYQSLGCKDNDDIKTCGKNMLPPETAFLRPVVKGHVTSEFGYRTYTKNGKKVSGYHYGIDMSESGTVPIYAAGRGMVIAVFYKQPCGGNMVYIHHNVNGKTYTTMYAHLRKVYVSKGDVVDRDTQIGTMGGSPSTEPWDECTTGQHLHFQIATGLYYKDYSSSSNFSSRSFNPRNLVNFPKGTYVKWYDRWTKY